MNTFASGQRLFALRGPMRMTAWHCHSLMLDRMPRWHLTTSQILALYCHDLPFEAGDGFSRAAKFYFGKQPDAWTADELATIVAVGRAPRMNSPTLHPERLEASKKQLLSAYGKGQ